MKYQGIDERAIKCACSNENCIESGISFEEHDGQPILRFHFLEPINWNFELKGTGKTIQTKLTQTTKSMILDAENTTQLITELKEILKQCRKKR